MVVTAEAILLAHTFQKRKSGAGKKAGEAAAEDSPKAYFVWKPVKIETYGVYESSGIGSEPAYYLDYMLAYEYDDHARVLFSVFRFSVTQGALISGIQKALRLSIVSAFSQCAVCIRPKENTLLALTIDYYKSMSDSLRNTKLGNKFIK